SCNNIAVEGEEGFAFKFFLAKGVISDVWIDSVIIRDVTVIPVAGINVSQPTVNLATGQSGQWAAFTIPAYASNQTITWSSSNTSVAKVSSTGVITPVSPGSAIITVTSADGTHTAQSDVTVTVGPEGIVPDAIEFAALKDLYDNLGGPTWTNKTNWPSPGNWP